MQKEWIELTERWKRHLIRECVRQAIVLGQPPGSLPYEDEYHGLRAAPLRNMENQWIVTTPDRERWHARVGSGGRVSISPLREDPVSP